ncbi:MAG: ABC transporter ATP-binding protein [Candidatus Heimdallarchaeota archaeon]|nr:ABC transporter ATP-binding protein [Candidatus Heimdallarchaeota archaeon]MCK5048789.1 ABC transporter ATP-binding protein [Candidatus Heimdallarchaeota archaeon]
MPRITFNSVIKKFGQKLPINDLSFVIEDGEFVVLLGPTGAGKTTTLKLLAGLETPNEGSINFDNEEVNNIPPEDRKVGFVFEQFNLFPHMHVLDNLIYGPRVHRDNLNDARIVASEMLDMMYLDDTQHLFPNELSGGMKQRVGIARAVSGNPQLLLMDEPLGALDAKIRGSLRIELRNLVKELGLTCVMATHDTLEAFTIADRILCLNNGQIEQIGTPEEIYNSPKTPFVANIIAECNNYHGVISEKGEEYDTVKLENGLKLLINSNSHELNTKVQLIIKANDIIQRTKSKSSEINEFELKIVNSRLLGDYYRWSCTFGDDVIKFKKMITPEVLIGDRINQKVRLVIPPNKIFIYQINNE